MKANNWAAYQRREREREEMTDTLNRGAREINKSLNELEGWGDRIMRAILAPAGKEAKLWFNNQSTKNGGAPYKREQ
jgi:hypothetical protein